MVSQRRLRPRRFDSTVKRVMLHKFRFEPVSFLFLACFSIHEVLTKDVCKFETDFVDLVSVRTSGEDVTERIIYTPTSRENAEVDKYQIHSTADASRFWSNIVTKQSWGKLLEGQSDHKRCCCVVCENYRKRHNNTKES